MVFTFLKARGLSVGSSLVEEDKLDLVRWPRPDLGFGCCSILFKAARA